MLEQTRAELSRFHELYHDLVSKDQSRFDALLAKQTEIVDQRLGLGVQLPQVQVSAQNPIKKRKPWNEIRSEYEAKKRAEFWASKIEEVERQDMERANVSTTNASGSDTTSGPESN